MSRHRLYLSLSSENLEQSMENSENSPSNLMTSKLSLDILDVVIPLKRFNFVGKASNEVKSTKRIIQRGFARGPLKHDFALAEECVAS